MTCRIACPLVRAPRYPWRERHASATATIASAYKCNARAVANRARPRRPWRCSPVAGSPPLAGSQYIPARTWWTAKASRALLRWHRRTSIVPAVAGAGKPGRHALVGVDGCKIARRQPPDDTEDATTGPGRERADTLGIDHEPPAGKHRSAERASARATRPHEQTAHVRSVSEMQGHAGFARQPENGILQPASGAGPAAASSHRASARPGAARQRASRRAWEASPRPGRGKRAHRP